MCRLRTGPRRIGRNSQIPRIPTTRLGLVSFHATPKGPGGKKRGDAGPKGGGSLGASPWDGDMWARAPTQRGFQKVSGETGKGGEEVRRCGARGGSYSTGESVGQSYCGLSRGRSNVAFFVPNF